MRKLIALLIIAAFACTPDDSVAPLKYEYTGIVTTGVPTSVLENSGTTVNIPVFYGGDLENPSAFTVSYTVTGGVYGADYTIVGGTSATGSVTIPAGATGTVAKANISIVPVGDVVFEPNVVLTVTLNEASNGASLGFPLKSTFTLTLANDDCNYVEADFAPKTAQGKEIYSDASCYPANCTSTYAVGFTAMGGNVLRMNNFWDSGITVDITIDPVTLAVTVPTQMINYAGAVWTISGTGTVKTCAPRNITITTHFLDDGTYGYDDTFNNIYSF